MSAAFSEDEFCSPFMKLKMLNHFWEIAGSLISQNYRTVWVGRDLKAHLVPTPLPWTGTLPLDQVAQSLVQPGLEHCQGGGSLSVSGQPVPGPHQELQVLEGHYKVSPEPSVLQAEQPQLFQPFLIAEVFHPSDHFCGPPLDPLQQVHGFPVLRTPELDTGLQVGSQFMKVKLVS